MKIHLFLELFLYLTTAKILIYKTWGRGCHKFGFYVTFTLGTTRLEDNKQNIED